MAPLIFVTVAQTIAELVELGVAAGSARWSNFILVHRFWARFWIGQNPCSYKTALSLAHDDELFETAKV